MHMYLISKYLSNNNWKLLFDNIQEFGEKEMKSFKNITDRWGIGGIV
jgi:hypothetical protein